MNEREKGLEELAEEMGELGQLTYLVSIKLLGGYMNNEEASEDIRYVASGLNEFQTRLRELIKESEL